MALPWIEVSELELTEDVIAVGKACGPMYRARYRDSVVAVKYSILPSQSERVMMDEIEKISRYPRFRSMINISGVSGTDDGRLIVVMDYCPLKDVSLFVRRCLRRPDEHEVRLALRLQQACT